MSTKQLRQEVFTINYLSSLSFSLKLHDIDVTDDSHIRRKRKRPRRLEDSVILETVGSHNNVSISDHFQRELLFPIIDKFLLELNSRFNETNILIMKGISSCTPSSTTFLSLNDLSQFARD